MTSSFKSASRTRLPNAHLLPMKIGRRSRKALFAIGNDFQRTANKEILKGPKTGKVYIVRGRLGRKRRHRSSAPGETHANIRGTLRKSMGWKVSGHKRLVFGYGVVKNAPPYAKIEHGYGRVKARPTLLNSIKANRRNTMNHLERAMKKALVL